MITTTLALSDGMQIAFFIISSLITVAALALGILAKNIASRYERLRDQLEKKNESEIDQRFQLLEARVMAKVDKLIGEIESAQRRLGAGDRLFRQIQDQDHQDKLKTLQAIEALHREVIQNMATKSELGRVEKKHDRLATTVAGIQGAA